MSGLKYLKLQFDFWLMLVECLAWVEWRYTLSMSVHWGGSFCQWAEKIQTADLFTTWECFVFYVLWKKTILNQPEINQVERRVFILDPHVSNVHIHSCSLDEAFSKWVEGQWKRSSQVSIRDRFSRWPKDRGWYFLLIKSRMANSAV